MEICHPCAAMMEKCSWTTYYTSSQHYPKLPQKLMATWSIGDDLWSDDHRQCRPPKNVIEQLGKYSLAAPVKKSTHQVTCERGLTRNMVGTVLKKDMNFQPWKLHNIQELSVKDCNRCMEYREIMRSWYEDWSDQFHDDLWNDEAIFHVT